jgi:hypothetical protein
MPTTPTPPATPTTPWAPKTFESDTTVEVKGYHPVDALSEETLAFTATIHMDGKRIGTASNEGRGGCNRYSFDSREAEAAFQAYAREWAEATGAAEETSEHDDALITFLCEEHELAKGARSLVRQGAATVILIDKGPQWFRLPEDGEGDPEREPDLYKQSFLVGIPAGGSPPEEVAAKEQASRWRVVVAPDEHAS